MLTSVCFNCESTSAPFSWRTRNNDGYASNIEVGGKDLYISLCEICYYDARMDSKATDADPT